MDEVAYYLYEVELNSTSRVKQKGKLETRKLLEEILNSEKNLNIDLVEKINKKIESL